MVPELRIQPMPLHTGSGDEEGGLVLADGKLVAVLVRLADRMHGDLVGHWHLEAGFGPCAEAPPHPVFASLDAVSAWVERRLAT